jgi:hypothetical protein
MQMEKIDGVKLGRGILIGLWVVCALAMLAGLKEKTK